MIYCIYNQDTNASFGIGTTPTKGEAFVSLINNIAKITGTQNAKECQRG